MEMTVGKYIPNDTIIHRLDPRVKLFINILLIVLVFLTKHYFTYALLAIPIFVAYFSAKLPFKRIFTMMKPVIFITIFLFLINTLIIKDSPNNTNIWFKSIKWWHFTISTEALNRTLIISARVYMMIIITTLMTSSTKPVDLTRGLEDLMLPLKIIKFPVHIIAMIISIALRFIPTLLDEAQRIMKAQASRGVDFKNGGIKSKVKSLITLIIPLFVTSFDKAFDLGNAMEVRGYDPYSRRTRYREYSIKWFDLITLIVAFGLLIIISFGEVNSVINWPSWWY